MKNKKIISVILACILVFSVGRASYSFAGGDLIFLINSSAGASVRTDCKPLDRAVDEIFSKLFKPGMSTYDKVTAVYNYMIINYSGGSSNTLYPPTAPDVSLQLNSSDIPKYYKNVDSKIVSYASSIIGTHKGTCINYSSAFIVFMKALGLDCFLADGTTSSASGGMTEHWWPIVILNGQYYIFDAQVDDHIANGGSIRYLRFGYTVQELAAQYVPSLTYGEYNRNFGRFSDVPIPDITAPTAIKYNKTGLDAFDLLRSDTSVYSSVRIEKNSGTLIFCSAVSADDFYRSCGVFGGLADISANGDVCTGSVFTNSQDGKRYLCAVLGDADKNGVISTADARVVLRTALSLDSLSEISFVAADVDADEKITSRDARFILQKALKLAEFHFLY